MITHVAFFFALSIAMQLIVALPTPFTSNAPLASSIVTTSGLLLTHRTPVTVASAGVTAPAKPVFSLPLSFSKFSVSFVFTAPL